MVLEMLENGCVMVGLAAVVDAGIGLWMEFGPLAEGWDFVAVVVMGFGMAGGRWVACLVEIVGFVVPDKVPQRALDVCHRLAVDQIDVAKTRVADGLGSGRVAI